MIRLPRVFYTFLAAALMIAISLKVSSEHKRLYRQKLQTDKIPPSKKAPDPRTNEST